MAEILAVLFDKDGTLIDFEASFSPAVVATIDVLSEGDNALANRLFTSIEFDLDTQSFGAGSIFIGGTARDVAQVFNRQGLNGSVDQLAVQIDELLARHCAQSLSVFDGTAAVIDTLIRHGFAVGLATNDAAATAKEQLAALQLDRYFSFVAGYDSGHGAKPGPGMIEAFAAHQGVAADQIAMVGDSANDMNAARAAGAVPIAVASGIATAEDLRQLAPVVLSGIGDLPRYLNLPT